ncbi:MAG: phosphoenolpyruvate synthase [Bellilinea sp.]|nr:MAG: phosphoenolpyruvate synthase [Bellilinea sp.]
MSHELSGGKGANLARLRQAGFAVPPGVIVSTAAYRAFVQTNRLSQILAEALAVDSTTPLQNLEEISTRIRRSFEAAALPADVRDEIAGWYDQAGRPLLAVRSSATTEDLPGLSFAGQQDTFLNVSGEEQLLRAVVGCWSSLWTARAIRYRLHQGVPQSDLALAVILQNMVRSRVSGVMFTANPLNGARDEVVINAAFGLGDALVSGLVEPDEYRVDVGNRRIVAKKLGAKSGSLESLSDSASPTSGISQALPDEFILRLAELGKRIEAIYDFPQDIEWAWVEDGIHVLQSRPITSLYPLPEGLPPKPLHVLFSFAAVQGVFEPITPFGREIILRFIGAGGRLLGYRLDPQNQRAFLVAGERLWGNVTPLLHTRLGRKVVPAVMEFVEPSARQWILQLLQEPEIGKDAPLRLKTRLHLMRFAVPLLGNLLLNLLNPDRRRAAILNRMEAMLVELEKDLVALPDQPIVRLAGLVEVISGFFEKLPMGMRQLLAMVATGMGSLNLVRLLVARAFGSNGETVSNGWQQYVLELTRSLPYNPTTQMDLHLWAISRTIRQDEAARMEMENYPAPILSEMYQEGRLTPLTRALLDEFLERYGRRGMGEIDAGRPRWKEDSTALFDLLKTFLRMEDDETAPDRAYARGQVVAGEAIRTLCDGVRRTRGGWLRARLVAFLASRVRAWMGLREYPKFFLVRVFGAFREVLLQIGDELSRRGWLERADDLVFLKLPELRRLAENPADPVWRRLIAERRMAFEYEMHRRQVPRILLSDGRAFYAGIVGRDESQQVLWGSPVSPGVAEGRVRVVTDPRRADLQPGEIMVCPGTDPTWTPLFLTAGGLIMEMGGMMTHGAVVAREYGLPAVVGVDQATRVLRTGQRVRLDGSTGRVDLLNEGD